MKEKYHKMGANWILGWYLDAVYASKNFSENYTATMMQASEFAPTAHSKLTYNEAFRANQYVAAGIRPIYRLNQMFHVRGEFYGFCLFSQLNGTPLIRLIMEKHFPDSNI